MSKYAMRCHNDGGSGFRRDVSLAHAMKLFSTVM